MLDSQTRKHLFANEGYIKHQGLKQQEDVLRIIIDDLFETRQKMVEKLQGDFQLEAEYKVRIYLLTSMCMKKENRFILLRIIYRLRVLFGFRYSLSYLLENGYVQSLLIYAVDSITRLDLIELYQLYRKHYPGNTVTAISAFLRYLKLAKHFYTLPTNRELMTLLTIYAYDAAKFVAFQLGSRARTVEEYKQQLRSKLNDLELDHLLVLLRKYPYQPIGYAEYTYLILQPGEHHVHSTAIKNDHSMYYHLCDSCSSCYVHHPRMPSIL